MKFLIISNLYQPYARGGAEAVVKTTAKGLLARGHEVIVLTAGPKHFGLKPREELVNGVRVLRFFPLNIYFVGDDWRFPKVIRLLARLIDMWNFHSAGVVGNVIDREAPDVVITHNIVGFGMLTPRMIRRKKKKHIHVLHDVQLIHPSGLLLCGDEQRAENNPLRKWYELLMKQLFGSPNAVIAPSRWLLDFHTDRGFFSKSKKEVLPNPVDCNTGLRQAQAIINIFPERSAAEPKGIIRLLYAGQLEKHKGIMWLIEQVGHPERSEVTPLADPPMAEIPANAGLVASHTREILRRAAPRNDLILEIAGAGSLESEVKSMAAAHPNKIIFHGKLDAESLLKKMSEVDALVVPSLCYENTPRIITEAHCTGLPVIASRIGGIPEMVRDGENGFLFTPGSYEEMTSAIEKLTVTSFKVSPAVMTISEYLDKLLILGYNP